MRHDLLRAAKIPLKEYWAPVVAAALMFGGINELVATATYPLTRAGVWLVNSIIRRGFRDVMPIGGSYYSGEIPWRFHATIAAESVIVIVLGIFLGLWVHQKNDASDTPESGDPIR